MVNGIHAMPSNFRDRSADEEFTLGFVSRISCGSKNGMESQDYHVVTGT